MKIYVPADGEMCNVHHDLDCCGRKFNRPDPHTKGIAEGLRMARKCSGNHSGRRLKTVCQFTGSIFTKPFSPRPKRSRKGRGKSEK